MSFFNNPPFRIISTEELEHVLNTMRSRHTIPHDLLDLWRETAKAHLNEYGQFKGMDEKELVVYIASVEKLTKHTRPQFSSVVGEFHEELKKALEKSRYGSTSFI